MGKLSVETGLPAMGVLKRSSAMEERHIFHAVSL